jgi:hypothetical protein
MTGPTIESWLMDMDERSPHRLSRSVDAIAGLVEERG